MVNRILVGLLDIFGGLSVLVSAGLYLVCSYRVGLPWQVAAIVLAAIAIGSLIALLIWPGIFASQGIETILILLFGDGETELPQRSCWATLSAFLIAMAHLLGLGGLIVSAFLMSPGPPMQTVATVSLAGALTPFLNSLFLALCMRPSTMPEDPDSQSPGD